MPDAPEQPDAERVAEGSFAPAAARPAPTSPRASVSPARMRAEAEEGSLAPAALASEPVAEAEPAPIALPHAQPSRPLGESTASKHLPAPPPALATAQAPPQAIVVEAAPPGLQPAPITPRLAEAPPGAPPPAPPPMRQVAHVAVALAFTPAGSGGFQLSLEPGELGRVEIRVQREGETHAVRIVAERPETLALLLRDRQELDRGLADAGLRVEAKGIEFSLGTSSGEREPQGRHDARGGPPPRGAGPTLHVTATEPASSRAARGLLDLNI
ncbi:flagellar hook-length control protein FliK [Roseococcus sp. SDR]|uniref:flagellar hook-length control protein FliK n=1 Tax=Roseococcus sp. SDR TaxID=2835532 RepID=UPI001BCD82C2|nr:flagellar hook-length control protein FliK [Roseococcus sp. SDR]MBS7792623.1 flagellar hook-length control protein FliK [Roseococcus sp. SDR]MBV1847937.1 flagellar hook-length control protein FliK [Roseococcus sp. SDR]